jgi:Tfp pilus assembly PilM family ATPase
LAKKDEISSTEKLLGLIRQKNDKEKPPADLSDSETLKETQQGFLANVVPLRKKVTIGVDIGYYELRLCMINQVSDKKQELLDFITIPYEDGISAKSPKFPQFLKSALKNFCGRKRKIVMWSSISSAKVETRNLKIPKVSKKQIDNAAYWTLKKDISFNDDEMLFDYEILGDVVEYGINKIELMAYVAPRQEIAQLKNLFEKIGYPLSGISIIPFALQNLFRAGIVPTQGKDVCSLFIGRDWSRIVIYSNGNLVLSRGIKAGIRSMIEAIAQSISKRQTNFGNESAKPSESSIFGINDETYILDMEQARNIFLEHISGAAVLQFGDTGQILQEHNIFGMIQPALERLVKQVERTLSHYYLHFNRERISRIFVSGQMSEYRRLFDYMHEQLDIPIDTINPFSTKLNYLGIAAIPESPSDKEEYAPAIGLALSNNVLTPNFIYTFKDKQLAVGLKKTNFAIFAGALFFLIVCLGLYAISNSFIQQKQAELARLEQEIDTFKPLVSKNLILNLASRTKDKRSTLKTLGNKYSGLAVINEISALTPEEIRLLTIQADFGKDLKKGSENKNTLKVEGIVTGDRLTFESRLAAYIVALRGSPMFRSPSIENKAFKYLENKEVMVFTARLDLV